MKKEEIIKRVKKVHGDKYILSAITDTKTEDKITIICPTHGEFTPRLKHLLNGHGCPKCSKKARKTFEEFEKEANVVHGNKYIYNDKTYINSHTKLGITCPKHGVFYQTPTNHLNGNGCPECKKDKLAEIFSSNTEEFIEKAKKIHGDKYIYTKTIYKNNHSLTTFICPIHGEFQQTPQAHLSGRGCSICKESHLERELRLFLIENNIEFEKSKHFDWLGRQEIDFYLPQYNIGIECQGKHHIGLGGWSDNFDFKHLYECDKKKNILCNENDLKLFYLIEKNYYQAALQFETYNEHNTFIDKSELLKQII